MEEHPDPAAGFVRRLLANRALASLAPLQKEEQILRFLDANAQGLYPTLSGSGFFPGRPWAEILSQLRTGLLGATDDALKPWLEHWVRQELDLGFAEAISSRSLPADALRDELWRLSLKLLQKAEARQALTGPLAAIQLGLPNRYLERSFRQRQYIHFELTKVQRLRLDLETTRALVAVTMLLRPSVHFLAVARNSEGCDGRTGVVTPQFAAMALESLRSQVRYLPAALLRGAVGSNCSFQVDRRVEATARLAAIFACRGRSYNSRQQVDRGASTPDRSWFDIARRNCRYYGFDIKMLDELYRIAAENGW